MRNECNLVSVHQPASFSHTGHCNAPLAEAAQDLGRTRRGQTQPRDRDIGTVCAVSAVERILLEQAEAAVGCLVLGEGAASGVGAHTCARWRVHDASSLLDDGTIETEVGEVASGRRALIQGGW